MSEEKKLKATINIPAFKPAQHQQPLKPSSPMRTQKELTPLAHSIAQNDAIMRRFRAVIGSEDKTRATEMIDEITKFAQNLDPSITTAEGTRIVVILMSLAGQPQGRDND
jgi:hypothetical protein